MCVVSCVGCLVRQLATRHANNNVVVLEVYVRGDQPNGSRRCFALLSCLLACLLKLADSFEWEARLDGI
jgi:hypothetical protein